jgi:hypothetical protein
VDGAPVGGDDGDRVGKSGARDGAVGRVVGAIVGFAVGEIGTVVGVLELETDGLDDGVPVFSSIGNTLIRDPFGAFEGVTGEVGPVVTATGLRKRVTGASVGVGRAATDDIISARGSITGEGEGIKTGEKLGCEALGAMDWIWVFPGTINDDIVCACFFRLVTATVIPKRITRTIRHRIIHARVIRRVLS